MPGPQDQKQGKPQSEFEPRTRTRGKRPRDYDRWHRVYTRKLFQEIERTVDPEFAPKVLPWLRAVYKYYFRCEMTGWENVPPKDKKVLFVSNHNGLLTFEVLMLFYAWRTQFEESRKTLGLAHAISLQNPVLRWLMPRLGAVPATHDFAMQAFEKGYSLWVFPGGEKEAMRPFSKRKQIEFFQRKGFIKLALKARVPIIPIISVGAQETYIILNRGEKLAEWLGLTKRFRMHGFPLTPSGLFTLGCLATGAFTFFPLLFVPAGLASTFLPLPAKMTFRVLPEIDVCAMVDPDQSEEQNLKRIYYYIQDRMQEALTSEYKKRKWPIIG